MTKTPVATIIQNVAQERQKQVESNFTSIITACNNKIEQEKEIILKAQRIIEDVEAYKQECLTEWESKDMTDYDVQQLKKKSRFVTEGRY